MRIVLLTPLVLGTTLCARASFGDRADTYINCVSKCESRICHDLNWADSISLPMRITQWSCTDDCKYGCMHAITDLAVENSEPIQQYHGKWPFWRFAGMQEPASVVFSLLNMWVHIRGAMRIQRMVSDNHPMGSYYRRFALVSVNAWIWSSVFHTRDLPTTEKLDYFSAALAILYALYFAVIRLFHLYPEKPPSSSANSVSVTFIAWKLICVLVYLMHVSYLSLLPRFDYTYNIIFNLVVGMTHNLLWLTYSLPASIPLLRRFPYRPRSYRPPYASRAAVFVILTTVATFLELFDFPPWGRIIDAHSLWHLATVPITVLWYDFLVRDALDDGWKAQKA
ncbi:Per1-like protein [Laetiporus sulphureus 93-53]|uniref:Post-GPI attachment to proteins factor 3 n=1 Tax=Laetiporus sulphureus 93-53 TaxID=1314785 RepID=A0A165CUX4_9APHY|nr:Per1-like protein [Laetiporus sulphureus 93-53]KZT03471.1 Per1-like protein [Laetiporus sulphureus 93-53]